MSKSSAAAPPKDEMMEEDEPGTSQDPVEDEGPNPFVLSLEEIAKYNKICEDHHRRMILTENLFIATKTAIKNMRNKQLAKKRAEVDTCTSTDFKTRCSAVYSDFRNQLTMATAERDLRTESLERKHLAETHIADFTEAEVNKLKEQAEKHNRKDTKLFEEALTAVADSMKNFLASEPHDINLLDFSKVREQLIRYNCPPAILSMCDETNFTSITLRDVVDINDLVEKGCALQ